MRVPSAFQSAGDKHGAKATDAQHRSGGSGVSGSGGAYNAEAVHSLLDELRPRGGDDGDAAMHSDRLLHSHRSPRVGDGIASGTAAPASPSHRRSSARPSPAAGASMSLSSSSSSVMGGGISASASRLAINVSASPSARALSGASSSPPAVPLTSMAQLRQLRYDFESEAGSGKSAEAAAPARR